MGSFTSQKLGRSASDEELMLAVRLGDLGAFEHLVVRHQTLAWQAAYRFLGDRSEAEDIAQEAFLRILDAAERYEPSAKFRTYLYRVITHLCLDYARKKRPQRHQELNSIANGDPSALDRMSVRENERDVRLALDRLPPNQRMAVLLRYYEALSYAEIAVAMDTSVKAVERLLARARATLESALAHLLE